MSANQGGAFKGRHFSSEVILWALRWYLAFPISYRDLAAMLADRGVAVDHTTLFRWIQAYAATLEKRVRRYLSPCTSSWRVDETYIKVKGVWTYLYRAVDNLAPDHRFSALRPARCCGGTAVLPRRTGTAAYRASAHDHRRQESCISESGSGDEADR